MIAFKWYVSIAFSSAMAQPEVSTFLVSYESSYFSHYNSKISASNSLHFGSYTAENVPISGIPILIFLNVFS